MLDVEVPNRGRVRQRGIKQTWATDESCPSGSAHERASLWVKCTRDGECTEAVPEIEYQTTKSLADEGFFCYKAT